ncbi:MAG: sulfotransferase [Gammaproteobacteria bacterium]
MHLEHQFYTLPLRFDVDRLTEEAMQFPDEAWREHPSGYEGNTALILVSSNGGQNDEMTQPMRPTDRLVHCPYIQQVLASFNTVIGRCRLMRIEPGKRVHEHADVSYYWRNRVRIHIPIVTDPAVTFGCDGESVHMAPGESWSFDNWRMHYVENPSDVRRIHLVIDTVGSASFWRQMRPWDGEPVERRLVEFDTVDKPALLFESFDRLAVMAPAEMDFNMTTLVKDLAEHPDADGERVRNLKILTDDLRHEWRNHWMVHGPAQSGWKGYRNLINQMLGKLQDFPESLTVSSTCLSVNSILKSNLEAALQPGVAKQQKKKRKKFRFDRPVFIVSAPRAGSTLLFETLAANKAFWSLGDESHKHFEGIPALRPESRDFRSNRLTEKDLTKDIGKTLTQSFIRDLRQADGPMLTSLSGKNIPNSVRFLEKTPKNALRIPFLNALFPDALFIFLYRNPRDNISSLMDSWRSEKYVTYRELPGWDGPPWSHLLIPGWQQLKGMPLEEIIKSQWMVTNRTVMEDLAGLPKNRWCTVSYESFLADPAAELKRLCEFADVPFGPRMLEIAEQPLRNSKYTLTPPDPDKWKKNEKELKVVLPDAEPMLKKLQALEV